MCSEGENGTGQRIGSEIYLARDGMRDRLHDQNGSNDLINLKQKSMPSLATGSRSVISTRLVLG